MLLNQGPCLLGTFYCLRFDDVTILNRGTTFLQNCSNYGYDAFLGTWPKCRLSTPMVVVFQVAMHNGAISSTAFT